MLRSSLTDAVGALTIVLFFYRFNKNMKWIQGLFDRAFLLAAVFAAGCVPSFIVQYRQRMGGRLDQVLMDLAPFQEIANRQHGGSLSALIQHHLNSSDTTFQQEGLAIQTMADAAQHLRAGLEALNTDVLHQSLYLLAQTDREIARATWDSYVPAFSVSVESLGFALLLGGALWLVFLALWHGTGSLISFSRKRRLVKQ